MKCPCGTPIFVGDGSIWNSMSETGMSCPKCAEALEGAVPSGQTELTGCVEKPPLGLRPSWIVKEMRAKEITDAMERYWRAKKPVPMGWFDELKHLVG